MKFLRGTLKLKFENFIRTKNLFNPCLCNANT